MRDKRIEAEKHILMERDGSDGRKKRKTVLESKIPDAETEGYRPVDATPKKK